MSTLELAPDLRTRLEDVGPYLRFCLERAVVFALRLHSRELTCEHVLASLCEDEDAGATRVVLHAFADPETIGIEVLALCPGIMVVGSERCLPFSVRGVRLLEDARARAAERVDPEVTPHHLFVAALGELSEEAVGGLRAAGFDPQRFDAGDHGVAGASGEAVPAEGPLLKHFSGEARRGLGSAARSAAGLGRTSIAPVHVLIGALDVSPTLREGAHLTASRVRMAVAGKDDDATPVETRDLRPDERLRACLAALPAGSETADFLAWMISAGSGEVRALLARQKVTTTLMEHARGAFPDPAPPGTA